MSLTLMQSTSPIEYRPCPVPPTTSIYNVRLCTPPRVFQEEFSNTRGISGFYYDANDDKYRLLSQMSTIIWPSWTINFYEMSAETGLLTAVTYDLGAAVTTSWTSNQSAGGFKRAYAHYVVTRQIVEVSPADGIPNTAMLASPIVEPADIGGNTPSNFVLNRTDEIVGFNGSARMIRWNYGTNTELTPIAMPYRTILDTAYESDELAWVLQRSEIDTTQLVLVKVNYKFGTVEGYSVLPNSTDDVALGPDINAGVAYDSFRKTIAVFRHKAADPTGAAVHTLDFYKPIPTPSAFTAPTPLAKIVKDTTVPMLAHLIGDVGEAGGGRQVTIANSGSGVIKQKTVSVKANGTVPFLYEAPSSTGTDTITLEAEI